jgi:hypothetical protein
MARQTETDLMMAHYLAVDLYNQRHDVLTLSECSQMAKHAVAFLRKHHPNLLAQKE